MDMQLNDGACLFFVMGLRGIEWVIFELRMRENRGLRGDSAFRGKRYLA
jgi:hypothetical protein